MKEIRGEEYLTQIYFGESSYGKCVYIPDDEEVVFRKSFNYNMYDEINTFNYTICVECTNGKFGHPKMKGYHGERIEFK
jgi:hypothetical protein